MKVAHFCTFPHGGAAAAATRLHQSLIASGVESRFYYHLDENDCELDDSFEQVQFAPVALTGIQAAWGGRTERKRKKKVADLFANHLADRSPELETFSMADLYQPTPLNWRSVDADVVHLHWISYFADYGSFFESIPDQIPIVWSLHDTNPFTGGCHYPGDCRGFETSCGNCPQVANPSGADVSRFSFGSKQKSLRKKNVWVTAPCDWMLELSQRSQVWPASVKFNKIAYGLNVEAYFPVEKKLARQKLNLPTDANLIAFGAVDIGNPRKGFQYLLPSLERLNAMIDRDKNGFECVVFGSGEFESKPNLPVMHQLGYVKSVEQKRLIYSAADLVIVPSIEDNQPQVGLESLACGTPVVAFDTCGMPEYVIDQQTGLLARTGDGDDLVKKMFALMSDTPYRRAMGDRGRKLIETQFNREFQTTKFRQLYRSAIG